jgi:protein-S-isoprenylcysteine O-methyltransferase Ste14
VRVPLGFVFAALFLWRSHPTAASLAWSVPVVLAGAALRGYASGYLNKNAELATSGPYAHTRNPLYLGSLVLALGFMLAARSWVLLAAFVALFALIYVPTILSEEAWLRANFASFTAYCGAVPRFFPRITPARLGGAGEFSRALYLKHREYNAAMGAVAIYAVLALKLWWLQ